MVFWIGIFAAVLFAYSAIKLGFYHAWTMLFNLVIAVYVAVRISPMIEEYLPVAMAGQYGKTMALLATWLVTFLILHGIAYVLLIGQFEVTFPRVFNTLGSGILGFLAGFLIWSFGTLLVCTTPFSQQQYVKELGFETKTFQEAKMQPYLVWWCNFLDKIVASGESPVSAEQTIKELLIKPAKSAPVKAKSGTASIADPNDTNKPHDPNRQPLAAESNSVVIPP
jgi:Colicin V production protein